MLMCIEVVKDSGRNLARLRNEVFWLIIQSQSGSAVIGIAHDFRTSIVYTGLLSVYKLALPSIDLKYLVLLSTVIIFERNIKTERHCWLLLFFPELISREI